MIMMASAKALPVIIEEFQVQQQSLAGCSLQFWPNVLFHQLGTLHTLFLCLRFISLQVPMDWLLITDGKKHYICNLSIISCRCMNRMLGFSALAWVMSHE